MLKTKLKNNLELERKKAYKELEVLLDNIKDKSEKEKAKRELEVLMDEMNPSPKKKHQRSIGNGRGIDDKLKECFENKVKWIQIDSFLIQPTKEGVPVITIPLLDGTAFQPYMIYNGGSRALLFKNKKTGVVLDRINL